MQAYSNNLVDHHIILDLLPSLAQAYFSRHVPANLSYLQAAILLSLGLQQNDISSLEPAIQLPANQALALFNKVRHKPGTTPPPMVRNDSVRCPDALEQTVDATCCACKLPSCSAWACSKRYHTSSRGQR